MWKFRQILKKKLYLASAPPIRSRSNQENRSRSNQEVCLRSGGIPMRWPNSRRFPSRIVVGRLFAFP